MTRRPVLRLLARALVSLVVAGAGAIVGSWPVSAHEFSMESVMNAFIRTEAREAHLVIRVPLHVVKGIQLPLKGNVIDLASAGPAVQRGLDGLGQEIILWENDRRLTPTAARGRLSLPSDRSFERYEDAVAHVAAGVMDDEIYAGQGYLDAHLTYAITSPDSRFAVRTTVAPSFKNFLKLTIRYLPAGQEGRAMVITSRSGRVALNPSWVQAASGFVVLGIEHILSGIDHLLFLLCLVIPVRRLRHVLPIVTAFTAAHSFTLIGSAYGLAPVGAWFPPFVEMAIAASIVYMALENVVGADLGRRWLITALFGLVHGFGFSYALAENLQFAGSHLLVSLFAFNVGIELGQIAVLAVVLPALALLLRQALAGRVGTIILSALVAHTGWHWMTERAEVLWKVEWPALDGAGLTVLARWVAGILLAIAAVRLVARRAGAVSRRARADRVASTVQ